MSMSAPQLPIRSAQYSGVDVFELTYNGIGCMKRRRDQAMNATHILKSAGLSKVKRTKIIDRDLLTGEHEKVQGGYGKYQGTWVPLSRAARLAIEYGVYPQLRALIALDPDGVRGRDGRLVVEEVMEMADPLNEKVMRQRAAGQQVAIELGSGTGGSAPLRSPYPKRQRVDQDGSGISSTNMTPSVTSTLLPSPAP